MGRERKIFTRKSSYRDSRLFVIATEGQNTEPLYFYSLINLYEFQSPRIHIEVIPSQNGETSPHAVLKNLDEFKREYKLRENDELWMIIDRDIQSWTIANLTDCKTKCRQKNYNLCISNPNFEIWILLHFCDIQELESNEINKISRNERTGSRCYLETKIVEKVGSYNKSNPDFDSIHTFIADAISNNLKLTENNTKNILDDIGSDINLLITRIKNAI